MRAREALRVALLVLAAGSGTSGEVRVVGEALWAARTQRETLGPEELRLVERVLEASPLDVRVTARGWFLTEGAS